MLNEFSLFNISIFLTVSSYGSKIRCYTKSTMSYIIIDNYSAVNRIHTIIIYAQCVCTQLTRSIIYVHNINRRKFCNSMDKTTVELLFYYRLALRAIFITLFSSRLDFKFHYSCFFRPFNATPRLYVS